MVLFYLYYCIFNYWKFFIIVTFLFQLYYWFKVKNKELSQIYLIAEYIILYICIWMRYIFVRNYDFIYMNIDNLTMNWFWYLANGGYSLVLWYPNQWGLFIGTLTNRGYSLVFWYPNQWGLFIGTLISNQWGLFTGTLMPSHWDIAWP